jgi:predicted DNA binding protein
MNPTGNGFSNGHWIDIQHSSGSDGYARTETGTGEAHTDTSSRLLVADARLSEEPLALAHTIQRVPGATFVPDHHTLSSAGRRILYLSITGASEDILDEALVLDPSVVTASCVETFPDCLKYCVELTDDAVLVSTTSVELGAQPISVQGANGDWNARLQFTDRDALIALRQFCSERGIRFGIDALYETDAHDAPSTDLTDRQLEALRTAFESGYFEIPRAETQDDLADKLDISKTAVSHRLRRATARLVRDVLDEIGDTQPSRE